MRMKYAFTKAKDSFCFFFVASVAHILNVKSLKLACVECMSKEFGKLLRIPEDGRIFVDALTVSRISQIR